MKIIVSARLKPSQVGYKIIPISMVDAVDQIFILRKEPGPVIDKVHYIILPAICQIKLFNVLLTPFILAYHVKKLKIDLIISYNFIPHGLFAFIASKLTGVPFNYSQIDTNTIDYVKRGNLLSRFIMYVLKQAIFINVPGKISRDFYINKGIRPEKINLLHSTVDTENEYNPEEKEYLYDFVYVGVLEDRKRVDVLIKAVAEIKEKIPDFRFAIVGNGPTHNDLVRLSEKLGLQENVLFLGYQINVKVILSQSKIFLLASILEGIPCAVMEAMSLKVYPIVLNVADISDIVISDKTGTLLPESVSISDLAGEITRVLLSWDSLGLLRDNARKHIQASHSYLSASKKWEVILRNLEN
jgi:glycosyltransferase involved in cell wall biosynthesis